MNQTVIKILAISFFWSAQSNAAELAGSVKNCIQCHGVDGVGLKANYPNLYGQKKEYLIKQLKDFKSGARSDLEMKAAVAFISNETIENAAEYYSGLQKTNK